MKNKKTFRKVMLWFFALIILLIIYAHLEIYLVQVKQLEFVDSDIPDSFKGYKIVFISDIHHSNAYTKKHVESIVNKVNKLIPDLIILGGDYVDKSPEFIEPCFEELKKLKAKDGVFAVLGNHDHWEGAELTRKYMELAGILCIDNKSIWIEKSNQKIKIGGVGDLWEDIQLIDATIADTTINDFVILVSHNPDYAEVLDTEKVDLMLSGHTHGGAISFFGIWAPFVPSSYDQKYRTGLIKTENTKVLVSNGIGNIGNLPFRFFVRPQINIIELK